MMIAVSSFRLHSDRVYAANQIRARQSWKDCFDEVHYFGPNEPELEYPGHKTKFFNVGDWPSVKVLAFHSSLLPVDYVAIINADIVVSSAIRSIENRMKCMSLPAATSYRYEFNPDNKQINRKECVRDRNDRGMDIFIAKPKIWRAVAQHIPDYLRVGHQTWDTWVCGFFCSRLGNGFLQFTDERVIFHPKHEGRMTPHQFKIKNDDPCFTLATQPPPMPT